MKANSNRKTVNSGKSNETNKDSIVKKNEIQELFDEMIINKVGEKVEGITKEYHNKTFTELSEQHKDINSLKKDYDKLSRDYETLMEVGGKVDGLDEYVSDSKEIIEESRVALEALIGNGGELQQRIDGIDNYIKKIDTDLSKNCDSLLDTTENTLSKVESISIKMRTTIENTEKLIEMEDSISSDIRQIKQESQNFLDKMDERINVYENECKASTKQNKSLIIICLIMNIVTLICVLMVFFKI